MKNLVVRFVPKRILKIYRNKKQNKKISIYNKKIKKIKIENPKKVSVVIPNYNYEKFIIERIDSILLQTYPIYELIVLDDCSTDNSIKIIEQKIKNTKEIKIKLIKNEKNSGNVFSQWEKAFNTSKGDYIWIAEADDIANSKFLEEAMKGFEDKDVIISYTESMRIDENNKIISSSCRDWMTGVSKTMWNQSFTKEGDRAIIDCLSICNTIPNVSAVVWKKGDYVNVFKEAQKFRISGDWYIYFSLLKKGKLSYNSKSLNYFRKHNQSASTVAKRSVEIEELLLIQKEIRDNYELNSEEIHRQSYRYGNIIKELDEKSVKEMSKLMAKKIAWIIPHPIKGSGGIRTMVQNANFLVKKGFECDIYVEEDYVNTSKTMKERIVSYYGECLCNVYVGIDFRKQYDMAFSTYSLLTADYLNNMNVERKAYFIQDFEPWFEPMGDTYLSMERTYKYGFYGISIGKWLTNKLSNEYNTPMNYFDFCADLNIYKKLEKIEKENAICFIFQPDKARRCGAIGVRALMLVKEMRPDVKIYLYGSEFPVPKGLDAKNIGIVSLDKCNDLYNKCKVGLCISSSNPSRIPFEMMAAGLPVVDLHRENNMFDVPDTGVLLADSTPEAIATAIVKILDDEKLQKRMSKEGHKYMQDYPIEKGFEQFLTFVNNVLDDNFKSNNKVKKLYNIEAIFPSKEAMEKSDIIKAIPIGVKNTSGKVRFLVRIKRKIKRTYNSAICKLLR